MSDDMRVYYYGFVGDRKDGKRLVEFAPVYKIWDYGHEEYINVRDKPDVVVPIVDAKKFGRMATKLGFVVDIDAKGSDLGLAKDWDTKYFMVVHGPNWESYWKLVVWTVVSAGRENWKELFEYVDNMSTVSLRFWMNKFVDCYRRYRDVSKVLRLGQIFHEIEFMEGFEDKDGSKDEDEN